MTTILSVSDLQKEHSLRLETEPCCNICLDETDRDLIVGHLFQNNRNESVPATCFYHTRCLNRWAVTELSQKNQVSCPSCKQKINPTSVLSTEQITVGTNQYDETHPDEAHPIDQNPEVLSAQDLEELLERVHNQNEQLAQSLILTYSEKLITFCTHTISLGLTAFSLYQTFSLPSIYQEEGLAGAAISALKTSFLTGSISIASNYIIDRCQATLIGR